MQPKKDRLLLVKGGPGAAVAACGSARSWTVRIVVTSAELTLSTLWALVTCPEFWSSHSKKLESRYLSSHTACGVQGLPRIVATQISQLYSLRVAGPCILIERVCQGWESYLTDCRVRALVAILLLFGELVVTTNIIVVIIMLPLIGLVGVAMLEAAAVLLSTTVCLFHKHHKKELQTDGGGNGGGRASGWLLDRSVQRRAGSTNNVSCVGRYLHMITS